MAWGCVSFLLTLTLCGEAIELAKTLQPDIVLSEVVMPGLDGVETDVLARPMKPEQLNSVIRGNVN